jgi:ribosomal protein S18 acetylase RimI-like enzyme
MLGFVAVSGMRAARSFPAKCYCRCRRREATSGEGVQIVVAIKSSPSSKLEVGRMTVTIRNAVDADLDALIRLNAQVQKVHAQVYPADFKSLTDEGEVRDFLASVMRRTDHTLVVAQVDDAVVGYAWIEIQVRPQTPFTWAKKRVFLHHICVDSGHRRTGVGSALITCVEKRAHAAGIGEFALDMWSLNDTAQAFFESSGLETYRLFLRKQIVPGGKVQGGDF